MRTRVRTTAVLLLLAASCLIIPLAPGTPAGAAGVGGPVVIMGIDGEDGGPDGHGPITVYDGIINNIKNQVANGGSGILVIGGGHSPGDFVTEFWDQLSVDTGIAVTYVNTAANITSQSFAGFGIIAVAGTEDGTNGGITYDESAALATRSFDIATFVNGGGGLFVFQQGDEPTAVPYGFLGDLGTFVSEPIDFGDTSDVDVTAAGTAAGLSDALDVSAWHDQYTTFPSFLTVLATYAVDPQEPGNGPEVAALGGANVQIPTGIVLDPPSQTQFAGDACTFTATVTENEAPAVGTNVLFTVTAGPNSPASGTFASDATGVAKFGYIGANVGNDTIVAQFTDSQGRVRTSDPVTCGIFAPPTTTTTTTAPPPAVEQTSVVVPVRATPLFTG